MAIRRKLAANEEIIVHRIAVDPVKHPKLYAALFDLGLGRPRSDFIRDTLESALGGAPSAAPAKPQEQTPVAGQGGDADLAQRQRMAASLFTRTGGF